MSLAPILRSGCAAVLLTAAFAAPLAPTRNGRPVDEGRPAAFGSQPMPAEEPEVGCVKACPLDTAPCDAWLYKHADGRCSQPD